MAPPTGWVVACRYSRAVAQSSTASMRPRTRAAVSGFTAEIGSRILSTRAVSTACTESLPMTGSAYVASVASHCAACLPLRQPARCALM
jgi:hypothetical protein